MNRWDVSETACGFVHTLTCAEVAVCFHDPEGGDPLAAEHVGNWVLTHWTYLRYHAPGRTPTLQAAMTGIAGGVRDRIDQAIRRVARRNEQLEALKSAAEEAGEAGEVKRAAPR